MKQWYGSALTFVLGHKKGVLGGTIGLFVVALGCFFTLGRSFLPPFNEGSFTINISSLPGISLEESDKMGHRAEELLLSIPEIQTVARKTGRAELDEHALGVNVSEIEAPFELKDRSRSELVAEVREKTGYHCRGKRGNRPAYQPPYRRHAIRYKGEHRHQTVRRRPEPHVHSGQ